MALIQFTRNYRDLSTDAGFQFEFYWTVAATATRPNSKPPR